MSVHELKTWPESFEAIEIGDKLFEWRKDDRNYQEGDTVVLWEWDPARADDDGQAGFTGRRIVADVGYVLRGPAFGVPDGFCVFSLIAVGDVETADTPSVTPKEGA